MKEGNNNLMNGVERLFKLVTHVQSLDGQVSVIERDLLLQELRDLYMEVLTWDVLANNSIKSIDEKMDTDEVVTFENIMQDVRNEEVKVVPIVNAEQPKEEKSEVEAEEQPKEVEQEDEKVEHVVEIVIEPMEEQSVKEVELMAVEPVEEDSPFAPAEPEPEVVPAPESVMESIEGNQYEELFEEKEQPVEQLMEEAQPIEQPEESQKEDAPIVESKDEMRVEKEDEVKKVLEEKSRHEEEHPVAKESHKSQPKVAQPSLFDYLSASTSVKEQPVQPTLADKFGMKHATLESQLEQKVHSQKVSDLRTVININDKFSFMNELFHNNMKAYNDFILKLNSISNRDEALKYVEGVSQQNAWDSNSLAVKTFYKVMERKF